MRKPPRLSGPALIAARFAAETPGTDVAIREVMRRGLGIDQLAKLPEMWRGPLPLDARPLQARSEARLPADNGLAAPPVRNWPRSASSYVSAYADRRTTPRKVVERALEELAALALRRPSMNVLVASDRAATLRDADAAAERIAQGRPLGPLDGVPFLVKDEFDVAGLPTRLGSRCESDAPAERDSTVVERLRRAGAVFLGKTVCTEWGMSPIGCNVHEKMPHNAHDGTRAPGGSSTGSAVGVALGLAPIATAGDGGGSIRIPAALNGIFGIKPTFGRVSRAGDGFKGSVAHAGPVGSSTADLVAFLDAVASERDPLDALTEWAPPPPHRGFGASLNAGVRGLRIGIDDEEWQDAGTEVARVCRDALRMLEREGATLVAVKMPIARHASKIGYMTIAPESLAQNRAHWLERRSKIGDDVRLVFAIVAGFSALEHLDAQRLRTGLRREAAAILSDVDVLALPTTAITAPRYTEEDARSSFSDPAALDGLCRYSFLGNLTGLPAATAPVGVDSASLPVGLQILGDAWDEPTILSVLAHLERTGVAGVRRAPGAIDLLGSASTRL
jgi:aspartyl-tRNA(Asn)/glutamyl-tRNA(Gln) amidotransferase subunit A